MRPAKLTSLFALLSCLVAGVPAFLAGCSTDASGGGDDGSNDDDGDDDGHDDGDDDGPIGSHKGGESGDCSGDEMKCDGDDLAVCEDGELETYSCDEGCQSEYGFSSNSCSDDQCQCDGDPTDDTCLDGVGAFCACSEWAGVSCGDQDYVDFYVSCHQGDNPIIECYSYYVTGNEVDCEAAVYGCS
jgi:hypothetical protein